jgi:uncharacterized membrane protein YccC
MDRVTQFKEAIKVALAIVLSYYIAMRFAWMSPTWAAISVAFISLPTAGQSLNKGVLRMGGTLLAFVAGLFYLGLFPQDRWLFLISFTPYLAFVTYKVTGKNGQYFWYVAGFVTMMITTAGPGSSEHAFEFAAYRSLETLAGILIWTLISVFIWPRSNLGTLMDVSRTLLKTQRKLVIAYRQQVIGHDTNKAFQSLRAREGKLVDQLEQTISAAASESYGVRQVHHLWERLHELSVSMMTILDRLKLSFTDLQQIHMEEILPDLEMFLSALDAQLERARRMLDGKPAALPIWEISLSQNETAFHTLDHFQRAAVEVTQNDLEQLEVLTREMAVCTRELKDYETEKPKPFVLKSKGAVTGPLGLPPLDPDRVRGAVMVVASMWIASLIWIYINPPGHASWYQFVPNITLSAVQSPQMRFKMLKPFVFAYVVALIVYVFIMPELSVFWQIGLVIFAFTFTAVYFFPGAGRVALLMSMFNILGIQNEQTYSFAAMANAYVFTMLGLALVVALTYITRSPRPEKAFLSMVSRFFRSCEYIVSGMAESKPSRYFPERMRKAFYRREMQSLPHKLSIWGKQIDQQKFPANTSVQIESVVAALQVLVYGMEELMEARSAPQASHLMRELGDDVRAWRIVMEQKFKRCSERPEAESQDDLQKRLLARLAGLNARIEEVLNQAAEEKITDEESRNFYRLLGGFRSVSEASVAYAGIAGTIDWANWREEVFS